MNKKYLVKSLNTGYPKKIFTALFFFFTLFTAGNLYAQGPVITYTPLSSTCATGARVLTATITDPDGVPTTGPGRPVLYWQINSGLFTPAVGTWVSGNTYNFSFGTGATAGNLVSYYIVAQDNAGNVAAKPAAGAGGFTTNPPAVSTDPTSPDFYVIQTTLTAGTYNVGVGQTYVTITDAVNAYNNSCLSGAVTFLLMDAAYNTSEVFPITISNTAASSVNTLTIKPNTGISPVIQGAAPDAIFKLNGADYITIDGSNSGGTTRNLTIMNTSTSLTSTLVWVGSASASNGATHNTIKNCVLTGNTPTTTLAGIMSSSGVVAGNPAEIANSDNSYINNSINTTYQGIVLVGPAAGESNNAATGNTVGSTQSTKKLGYRGVVVTNQTNVLVNNNIVQGLISTFGLGSDIEPTGGIIVSGVISGGSIQGNKIDDIKNTSVAGWPAYGISLQASSAAANLKIYNNFIHSITGNGNATTAANNGIGINIQSGGGYGIFFNSINLFLNQIGSVGGISACIFIGAGVTGTASVDIRNNILSNRRTNGTNYAIYSSVPAIIFSNINYNDYYSAGFVGYLGSTRNNLAAWQAATLFDGNSVSVNPIFVSPTDLHLQLISPLNDQGQTISGITIDIDATTRNPAPDIGADEFTPPACSGNTGGTAVSDFITVCTSGAITLSATGFSYGLGIAYQWEKSTTGPTSGFSNVTGETNPTAANPPAISTTTWYRLRVTCAAGTPGYSNAVEITVYNPSILGTTPATRCGPGTVNLAATGTATTAIQWYTDLIGGAPIYTGSPFTTPSISANTTYYVESTFLGSSGTVGPVSPTAQGGTISTQLTSWDVTFNVIQATKLLTIDIFPMAAGEFSIIDVYNSSGSIIASVPYTTTVSGGETAQTITMNVSLPIGNGYYLYATNGLPPTGLRRNISGASYPYNSTDIQITGNSFDPTFFMCYYRWRFSNGCSSSPRVPVTATVGVSSTLNVTASPAAICDGSSSNLNVTSSNSAFTYTWLPGNLNGPAQTVSPSTTTTYTVNATDGTCTGVGSVTVTVNPASSDVNITPATVSKCSASPAVLLTAAGGDITGIPILTEDFNGAGVPAGWTANTNWAPTAGNSTGVPANSAWTLRPNNYVFAGNTFRSNDATQFYLSNSDANSGVTRTNLISPAFSLVGYTNASLNFWHYFAASGDNTDSICVEISQNGSSWTNIYSYRFSVGGSTGFSNRNINLSPFVGNASNIVRFRYYGTDDYWWALDNVKITGENSGAPITWAPITGLFTNPAGTIAYTGTAATSVYANPSVSTTYTATATPVNACAKSEVIDVTVTPLSATITGSTTVCSSGSAVITITLNGAGPWDFTYTDGTTPVTVTGVTTSPYTFTVNPVSTTTYTLTALSDPFCSATAAELTAAGSAVVTVSGSTTVSTWVGGSSDWTDPANWCGGVPTSTKDVVIPATANSPVISVLTAVGKNVSIAASASITVAATGKFSFTGDFTNNGTIINNGSMVLNGSANQAFPGGTSGTITAMNELEVNNNAGATIDKPLTITGILKPTAGTITLNNVTVTLHSDTTSTASVGALGASAGFAYNGANGKFSVERFITSASRVAWRLLAAPISGTQTISQAWQEGQAPASYTSTGYGMQIVGPGGAANGFDMNNGIPSLKQYNPPTNSWVGVPNTNVQQISSPFGYMAFIRGDRGSNTFGSRSRTTLRVAGPIKTGTIGPLSTPTAAGFICAANPYPSAIDFNLTTRTGMQNTYYLWDPKLGIYGGYQTFTGGSVTPGGGSYINGNKFIESGQAFFTVATLGAAPHEISFTEACKVSGSYPVQRETVAAKSLRTQLLSGDNLIDGVLVEFDPTYSNSIDDLDAPKLSNFGENISLLVRDKAFSVERHADIISTDTIFYQLGQLRQQVYQLQLIASDLTAPGLSAWLEDLYMGTSQPLDLSGTTSINFTVTGDAASASPARFRIVFRKLAPVPVLFTHLQASEAGEDVSLNWKVENEINITSYEIQRAADGRAFVKLGSVMAKGNNSGLSLTYDWLDANPLGADNFYRIQAMGISGEKYLSNIVKLAVKADPVITVYPNPVTDNIIRVHFNNIPAGDYDVSIYSASGQLISHERAKHSGGSKQFQYPVSAALPKGVYSLEIAELNPKSKKRNFRILLR